MIDREDVIILIRAVLAANKHATPISDLQKEYFSSNGTCIPFQALGFSSLLQFLRSEPSKFQVLGDTVLPVIDESLAALRKLVCGQKSAKKRKPSRKYVPPARRPFFNSKPSQNLYALPRPQVPITKAPITYYQPPRARKPSFWNESSDRNTQSTFSQNFSYPMPRPKFEKSSFCFNKSINLWIENPSSYLKESWIIVTHVESTEKIFIRLIGKLFSDEFNKLNREMKVFYEKEADELPNCELNKDDICVAYYCDIFCRVQIKGVDKNKLTCLFLDYGFTKSISKVDLFPLHNDFIRLRFQMIEVKLLNIDQFNKSNQMIKKKLDSYLTEFEFLARKTDHLNLTIKIYNEEKVCFNDYFVNTYKHFLLVKPDFGETFQAIIRYIEEDSDIHYLQLISDSYDYLIDIMPDFNEYYNKKENSDKTMIKDVSLVNLDEMYAGKFEDGIWYRCKITKIMSGLKVMAKFIDYGNKTAIELKDLRLIDDEKFYEFKHLPDQALPVKLKKNDYTKDMLNNLTYTERVVEFKMGSTIIQMGESSDRPSIVALLRVLTEDEDEDGEDKKDQVKLITEKLNAIKINSEPKLNSSNGFHEKIDLESDNDSWVTLKKSKNSNQETKSNSNESKVINSHILKLDDLNQIEVINFNKLNTFALTTKDMVYVSYVENPFDFRLHLVNSREEFKSTEHEINLFYYKNSDKFKPKEMLNEHIYVCRNENGNFFRGCVKKSISIGRLVYNIDDGYFELIPNENIFNITKRFLEQIPMAINAKLSKLKLNQNASTWTYEAKLYFKSFIGYGKHLTVKVYGYDEVDKFYEIDLFENNESISAQIASKKFAQLVR